MPKTVVVSNLDILRSIAVLAVFLTHTLQVIAGNKNGEQFAYGVDTLALGRSGVLIFFVHTSLVLMQSLERTGASLTDSALVRAFYIRRVFRIYPLAMVLILLSIVFSIPQDALGTPYQSHGVRWVLANILLIQNLTFDSSVSAPLWSLPLEVQMYVALPLIFLLVRGVKGNGRLIVLYSVGLLIGAYGKPHRVVGYIPCFLAGVIAYKQLGTLRPRIWSWLWCPTVIGVVTLYVVAPYSDKSSWKDFTLCLLVGVLIPVFQESKGWIAVISSHIAKYSYGIYLCHTPLLWLLYRKLTILGWQRPIWLPISVGLVSVACYHAIERPLIQAGTRLAGWTRPRTDRRVSHLVMR